MTTRSPLDTYDPDSPEAKACRSQAVGVHTLHSSPTNPRKTFDPAKMAELVESVKQIGILQPILVRPWPVDYAYTGDMPLYEVVAGERRYRAAKEAGLTLIPAMVRSLTTREVLKIQTVENLQREDLHPLEEAEGYEVMMRDYGYTADQLADEIGKSRSYVFGRTKLLQLDDAARRLFRGGVLNASTALLVARIPTAKLRTKAIKEITKENYQGDRPSVREAQRILQQRYMLRLAQASFPTDDATLVGGSCASCQKRTGNQPQDLFDDVDSPDVCTDPDCFALKAQAHRDRLATQAKAEGKEIITGEAARKIAPYGISEHSVEIGKAYVKLDAKCYDDPKERTYREILGDDVKETLIEDAEHNRLVPVIKNTVLADKLKAAGVETYAMKQAKADKKAQAKVETERAVRERLFDNIRTEVWNYTMDGAVAFPADVMLALLRDLVIVVFQRAYDGTVLRILKLWEIEGRNNTERKHEFPRFVGRCDAPTCWKLLVDLRCAGELSIPEWMHDPDPSKQLEDTARLFSIDPAEVRKDVVFERKAQEKAAKSGKKAAPAAKKAPKTDTTPAADPAPPSKAAQAAEEPRAKPRLDVGCRVRVKDDVRGAGGKRRKCCGREGVVESIDGVLLNGGTLTVRFAPGRDGYVVGLSWTDVEVIEDAPATEAARAAEETAARVTFGVFDRVRIVNLGDPDFNPSELNAYLGKTAEIRDTDGSGEDLSLLLLVDGDDQMVWFSAENVEIIETNETPIGTELAAADTGAPESETAGPEIETNEKPKALASARSLYAHPDDPGRTWSGRGKKPKWVQAWLAEEGRSLEDLRRAA